jgi:acetyl-CoA acetyltransferase
MSPFTRSRSQPRISSHESLEGVSENVNAVIRGIAEFPQGTTTYPSTMALYEGLVLHALADAGLDVTDVDMLLTTGSRSDPYLVHAQALSERMRIQRADCFTVGAGGAAAITMLNIAATAIEAGTASVIAIVGADCPRTLGARNYRHLLADEGPIHPEYERPFGPTASTLFALVARHYLDVTGIDREALGAVAIHDRRMAAEHPNAHFRAPLTQDEYASSPLVSDPLRRHDCAPISDGGGAAVVVDPRRVGVSRAHADVVLHGTGVSSSTAHISTRSDLLSSGAGAAVRSAQGDDVSRAIDVALLYDCFTIALVLAVESLGWAPRGRACEAFAGGEFSRSGLPVNTHGGLLSHGHPAKAAGFGNLVEAVVQLRGDAGTRQVRSCSRALVHGMSGAFAYDAAAILGRADD